MGQPGVAPPATDRRRAPRYPFSSGLEIEWGSAVLRGRVKDVSDAGMFIEIAEPLWIGASFQATWALDPPLRVECVVHRIDPGRGMGVAFTVAQPSGQGQIAALLENLARQ